jgi:tetratricopeptide (TPR) repeat protein
MRFRLILIAVLFSSSLFFSAGFAQDSSESGQNKKPQTPASDPIPHSDEGRTAPPVGDNESSSKETQIDISPPKDDAAKHPDSDVSDVTEMHAWNPHKADKNVEVGDFYMKRNNYHAAEARYREALSYKPDDAIATYRLAKVLDVEGQSSEALKEYEAYLKIPSSGKFAADAKKALARLEQRTSSEKR